MSTELYEPLYTWRRTKIDANDIPTDSDWSGYDGEIGLGRVQLQPHGPMKGKWMWSAWGPHRVKRHLPHQGYEPTRREAGRKVEEYYHALMSANGLKGSKQ